MNSHSLAKALAALCAASVFWAGVSQAQENAPLVFDFSAGGLPEASVFQGDRVIQSRHGGDISFAEAALPHRKLRAISIEGGKEGLRLKVPEKDALYGEMSALSISLFVKFDDFSGSPVFFQRLRGSRANKGLISFLATTKANPEDGAAQFHPAFRVATDDASGEVFTATEPLLVEKGKWYHFAMVYNGSEIRFYANGEILGAEHPTFLEKIPAIEPDKTGLSIYGIQGAVGEMVIAPNQAFSGAHIKSLFENGLEGVDEFSATN